MTNTKANLALRIANRANDVLGDRVAYFDASEAYEWSSFVHAAEFKKWLNSITFWASADGREIHGMGSTNYGWTFTPVEMLDNVLSDFQAELDAIPGFEDQAWEEPARAHHVLKLW